MIYKNQNSSRLWLIEAIYSDCIQSFLVLTIENMVKFSTKYHCVDQKKPLEIEEYI